MNITSVYNCCLWTDNFLPCLGKKVKPLTKSSNIYHINIDKTLKMLSEILVMCRTVCLSLTPHISYISSFVKRPETLFIYLVFNYNLQAVLTSFPKPYKAIFTYKL